MQQVGLQHFTQQSPAEAIAGDVAHALADELVEATVMLSDLAFSLGSDDSVLRNHVTSLQSVDLITQGLLAMADVLRSGNDAADAIGAIPVDEIAARMKQRLETYRQD